MLKLQIYNGDKMDEIMVRLSKQTKEIIAKHKLVNWERTAANAIKLRASKLALMDEITSKSKLTMKDVMETDENVKKGLFKRYSP